MTAELLNDIEKKWAIHSVHSERNKLVACLDEVINTINNSTLECRIKNILFSFYKEIKDYYTEQNHQDLINNSTIIKEYSQSYLINHDMVLIHGMLAKEHIHQPATNEAIEALLRDLHQQLQKNSSSLIGALQQVHVYAKPSSKKLDEEFYADDEENAKRTIL